MANQYTTGRTTKQQYEASREALVKRNVRWHQFAEAYLKYGHGQKAYQEAYPDASKSTAAHRSSTLLNTAIVNDFIQLAQKLAAETVGVTVNNLVAEMKKIAMANILDAVVITEDGDMLVKNIADLGEDVAPAIKKISISTGKAGRTVSIEMHDKLKALQMLGDYMGMFGDLNQMVAIARKLGYEVYDTEDGFIFKDTYKEDQPDRYLGQVDGLNDLEVLVEN